MSGARCSLPPLGCVAGLVLLVATAAHAADEYVLNPRRAAGDFNITGAVSFQSPGASVALGITSAVRLRVLFGPKQVLVLRVGAVSRRVASAPHGLKAGEAEPFLIKRRGRRIQVFLAGRPVLSAAVDMDLDGRWGLVRADVKRFKRPRLQRIEPPRFGDDFSRAEGEPSPWSVVRGRWSIIAASHPELSASPFAFTGAGRNAAVLAGRDFWDNYMASCSVYLRGPGESAGLVFYADGKGQLWGLYLKKGVLRLARLNGDLLAVLASKPLDLGMNAWHQFQAIVRGNRIFGLVDHAVVLQASDKRLVGGRVGLWADAERGVRFDDVVVAPAPPESVLASGDIAAIERAAERALPRPTLVFQQRLQKDSEMSRWAGENADWIFRGADRFSRGVYFNEITTVWTGDAAGDPANGMTLGVHARRSSKRKGYLLAVGKAEGGGFSLRLSREDKPIAQRTVKIPDGTATIALSAAPKGRLSVRINGETVLEKTDSHPDGPLDRGRVLFSFPPRKAPSQHAPGTISIDAPRMRAYTFDTAPVDWRPQSGRWSVRSLWACLPRYTWYAGGRTDLERLAVNRLGRTLEGDFQVEAIVAVGMAGDQTPYYEYPINFTLAAHAPDDDPTGGYLFQFGGPDVPTRILKRGKVLAESKDLLVPGMRHRFGAIKKSVHTTFFRLTFEKYGDRLRLSVDDRLVASAEDPKPLRGGNLFLLVADNTMTVSRVTISAERLGVFIRPGRPKPVTRAAARRLIEGLYREDPEISRSIDMLLDLQRLGPTPPLDARPARIGPKALAAWVPRLPIVDEMDAVPARAGHRGYDGVGAFRVARGRGAAVRVVNRHVGGRFAWPLSGPMDLGSYPRLEFDYRMGPRTIMGLRIKADGAVREYDLSGMKPERGVRRGPEFKRDGKWHTLSLDLVRLLGDAAQRVEYVELADPGWQANVRGDWMEIDRVIRAPVARRFKGEKSLDDGTRVKLSSGKPGLRRLMLTRPDGSRQSWPVVVRDSEEPAALKIGDARFGDSRQACPERIQILIDEGNMDHGATRLSIRPGSYVADAASPELKISDHEIRWTPPPGFRFPNGRRVSVTLTTAPHGGRPVSRSWEFTADYRKDRIPPTAPLIRCERPGAQVMHFEDDAGYGEVSARGGVIVAPHAHGGPDGSTCARVSRGGLNGWEQYTFIRRTDFSIDRLPILSFRYRIRPKGKLWLGARIENEVLGIFDSWFHGGRELPGMFEDLKSDRRWHYAQYDLRKVFAKYRKNGRPLVLQHLFFSGNRMASRGWVYELDDIVLAPGRTSKLRVVCRVGGDPSGIAGYAVALDGKPDTIPPQTVTSDKPVIDVTVPDDAAGTLYIHARARDGAGNWGPAAHLPVIVDPAR